MPEGDTVWFVARQLREALAGAVLVRSDLRVPKLATADLSGRKIEDVVPRGKHLLMRFEGGWTLHSHLRMEGAWRLYPAGGRWNGGPAHQIRAILATPECVAVGYRVQELELLRTVGEAARLKHLGPDLLGPDWDSDEALRRLVADPARPVGDALLDQRIMAGIGNVYKSELCFIAAVTPWTPVGDLPEPRHLVESAHRLLELNKARIGRVTTDDTRLGRALWVYGRARQPCPTVWHRHPWRDAGACRPAGQRPRALNVLVPRMSGGAGAELTAAVNRPIERLAGLGRWLTGPPRRSPGWGRW